MAFMTAAIIVLLALGWMVFRRPGMGALALVAAIPFDFPLVIAGRYTLHLTEVLLAAVLAGWLLHAGRRLVGRVGLREVLWALPFVAALLLSGWNAQQLGAVGKQTARWMELILGVWFLAHAAGSAREIRRLLSVMLALGSAMALLGIAQTLAGPGMAWISDSPLLLYNRSVLRAHATFGHPNQFAGYLVLLLPLAAGAFLQPEVGKRRDLAGAALFLLTMALVFTLSRGAWIAAFVSLAVLMPTLGGRRTLAGVGVLGAAVGLAMFLLSVQAEAPPRAAVTAHPASEVQAANPRESALRQPVMERVLAGFDSSVNSRWHFAHLAFLMFKDHPWIGFGAGEYARQLPRFVSPTDRDWPAVAAHIHNLYLQILIETGLAGLSGFLLLLGYYLAEPLRRLRQGGLNGQLLAVLAADLGFLLHNLFDVLTVYARGLHWALLLGLGLALARTAATRTIAFPRGRSARGLIPGHRRPAPQVTEKRIDP